MTGLLTGRLLFIVAKVFILPFLLLLDSRGGYGRIIALLAWDLLWVRHGADSEMGGGR